MAAIIYHGWENSSWKKYDACIEMNDPAIKLVLAMSIILGGLLAAIAFRPDPASPQAAMPSWSELAAMRNRRPSENKPAPLKPTSTAPAQPCQPDRHAASAAPARPPIVLTPIENQPAVPSLPSKYPGDGSASATGWGMPIVPPSDADFSGKGTKIHKIADGDTLASLAERYLGTPARAMDIYNANRETLSDPELLPIGVELKIPE
jgi:nucleoid-associated protein YgaU